jgi:hypothetical protein
MHLPAEMPDSPAEIASKFFYLASPGLKQEALDLVIPESRKEFTWPPVGKYGSR